jgi:two-component system response regulator NreC
LSAETNWNVSGEARNGSETLQKAQKLQPDLILLDVSLPDINGLEVARRLRLEVPKVKILVISQHDPVQLLPRVMVAGGDGCLDKSRLAADLVVTIEGIQQWSGGLSALGRVGVTSP